MSTHTSRSKSTLSSRRLTSSRAHYSPILPRNAQDALTRNLLHTQVHARNDSIVPNAKSLTPETPTLSRWWDPHLVDRLHTQLTRFRD
jgi:hypothetical protein